MSQIYINTKQSEERRIVIVNNGELTGFEQDITGWENKKGDIYKAVVTRVEEGLEAAFVNFGEGKNGFLPLKEISDGLPGASGGKNKVAEGDSILVQIKKDHVGDKGAGMTTNISLAGCYLVLTPNRNEKPLISKHLSPEVRQKVAEATESLDIPPGIGIILRTASDGCSVEDLRWDLESYLLKLWRLIESAAAANRGPILIYRENNLMLRAVRDYFKSDKDDIYCDDAASYEELKNFVSLISPDGAERVHYHEGDGMVPDAVERQIDTIYEREVRTSSGARLVFDSTEAMVSIDVNSAQTRGHSDIEATALRANMSAADTIARHLRLRDLSGLIVVDFIDMSNDENRHKLEDHFASLLRRDRARVQWAPLSKFGMIELSRQRLARPVEASQSTICPTCQGTGRQHRTEPFALRLLRQIRMAAQQNSDGALVVQSPVAAAIYLLNEKRAELRHLEKENKCEILVAPVASMCPPDFKIRSVKQAERVAASYQEGKEAEADYASDMQRRLQQKNTITPAPVIKTVLPEERASGMWAKLWRTLGGWLVPSRPDKTARPRKKYYQHRKNTANGQNRPRRATAANKALAPAGQETTVEKRPPQRDVAADSKISTAAATGTAAKKKTSQRSPRRRSPRPGGSTTPAETIVSGTTAPPPVAAAKPGQPLVARLAQQYGKNEAEVRAGLTAIGGDVEIADNRHTKLTAEMEEQLGAYFSQLAAESPAKVAEISALESPPKVAQPSAETAKETPPLPQWPTVAGAKLTMVETTSQKISAAEPVPQSSNGGEGVSDTVPEPQSVSQSLTVRLAQQYGKNEAEVRAGLTAIGGDVEMADDRHAEITTEMEEQLIAYFSQPAAESPPPAAEETPGGGGSVFDKKADTSPEATEEVPPTPQWPATDEPKLTMVETIPQKNSTRSPPATEPSAKAAESPATEVPAVVTESPEEASPPSAETPESSTPEESPPTRQRPVPDEQLTMVETASQKKTTDAERTP